MSGKRGHASTALAGVIRRRHDALEQHIEAARDGVVEGVHQARVASRRLREVVPVLAEGLTGVKPRRLGRRLRDLTRALGPVRELDVALGMIRELDHQDEQVRQLQQAWVEAVQARRAAPLEALRAALAPEPMRELDDHLRAFADAREASADGSWRVALARRLSTRADSLRTHIETTGSLFRAEPLHEVRIATKQLRYALEICEDAGAARLVRPLRTLKRAQDVLGRLHDLDVLAGLLALVPGVGRGRATPGRREIAASTVRAGLDLEARLLHARYLRARASLVRVTDLTRDVVAPRLLASGQPHAR